MSAVKRKTEGMIWSICLKILGEIIWKKCLIYQYVKERKRNTKKFEGGKNEKENCIIHKRSINIKFYDGTCRFIKY